MKARKFKRKLAHQKPVRKKTEPVLSVSIIGKENVEKIKAWYQKIYKFLMNKSVIS